MYAVVRRYHFDSKDSQEIDRQVKEEFLPIIEKAPGFVAYYWLDGGNGEGASLSVFKDREGAEESVRLAADFIKDHDLGDLMGKPEIVKGDVIAHS
jgi:hypothetical protein